MDNHGSALMPINKPVEDWPDLQRAVGVLSTQLLELENLSTDLAAYMSCRPSTTTASHRPNETEKDFPSPVSMFTGTGNEIQLMQDAVYRIRSDLKQISVLVQGKAEQRG